MPRNSRAPVSPFSLMLESWSLGMEAASVIWLRSLRLAAGGKLAEREAQRMVQEKVMANTMLLPFIAMGGTGQTAEQIGARMLEHYRGPIRANHRRLSRKRG